LGAHGKLVLSRMIIILITIESLVNIIIAITVTINYSTKV